MGAIHDMDNRNTRTRTVKEWAIEAGLNPDSVRKAITRKTGQAHGVLSVLTVDEWEMWRPGKPGNVREKSGKNPGNIREKKASVLTRPAAQNDVSPDIKPDREIRFPQIATVRRTALDVLLIGIVIGHAGLIWYDCAAMWGEPGQIGGGLAFCIVLAAVMLATDTAKNITSQYALFLAFLVDVGAYWVHFPTFQTYSVPDAITSVLCVFLCAMSFGALFLYRHQKNN